MQELARPATLAKGAAPDSAWAFLNGRFVPIREAKISVMTHAFNYGTGVFEGIRAYWSVDDNQLYGLHFREHYARILRSCRIMRLSVPHSVEDLVDITIELLRRCGYREDCYIRPIIYKSSELIGVRLHNLEDAFTVFAVPFGNYVKIEGGISAQVSSWRRVDDNAIPARSKITGSYVNAALAKTEAEESGFDEAIVLTDDGHVSEGSAANLFLVRDGTLVTAPASDNILEGIVRSSVLRIAADEAIPVEIRRIDRTELYLCDEAFLCGTGVQVAPITSIDRRPVGTGEVGPIVTRMSRIYFDAVRGKNAKYRDWLTPIYPR
ncbi:MAG TPA: branched-chain amino acid transaminase [Candidatus Limnocylindria bacterium]|nr:branched-chain amino acid transaminase [Candidatus Limnocylindria bacterium]